MSAGTGDMVHPLQSIDLDNAKRAGLSLGKPRLKPLGFWRHHEDSSAPSASGPYGYSVELARRDVEIEESGRSSSLNLTSWDLRPSRLEHFRRLLTRAEDQADAIATLPWPGEHVDPGMPDAERERVASLLDRGEVVSVQRGSSWDRLDPDRGRNGSCEQAAGGYVWPSGLSHYVRRYGLVICPAILAAIEADLVGGS